MLPRKNGFHGPAFPTTRGTVQGGRVPLTLFNVVVDNIIRTWLTITVEDQRVVHNGLVVTVRRCLKFLYADGGMVGSWDSDWI